ncbi:hypothetical protein KP509_28G064600 [Ceratopteris richardii]|uniref:RIN4 pathogenic type III effector avirulence factor Avr cleavage site domain-containing protein n=1 Tax=Ceratopteris richardii TaxID=49495 RepID=A0A8T2RER7_CERRI|nr:hypothetical protein KP509_28G064600 [Ceratopteris richardii]
MATGKAAGPLPKFGAWDEQDPSAGEGFTVIFNQARDERKTGGPARIPSEAPNPPKAELGEKPGKHEQSKFSIFGCCFRSSNAA